MSKKIILSALLLLIGFGLILLSAAVRRQAIGQVEKMLQMHVNTVAHLAKQSVSQGVWSTSTTYELYEEQLITTAHLFSILDEHDLLDDHLRRTEGIAVHFSTLSDTENRPPWNQLHLEKTEALARELSQSPAYELLENGECKRLGLICMVYEAHTDRGAICHRNRNFMEKKKKSGIGSLLHRLCTQGISYIALQDDTGILAVAPSSARISRWKNDSFVRHAIRQEEGMIRELTVDAIPHFEGVYPFEMADGTTVAMRVAIDASVFQTVKTNANQRHGALVALVIIAEILAFVIVFLIWRWKKKQDETERRMQIQKEEHQHWSLIGEMSATVAHEVRNPLNAIAMTAQRLQSEFTVPQTERSDFNRLLQVLSAESKQLNRIVTDFLELGKPIQLRKTETELKPFVLQVCAPFVLRAETETKTLNIDIPDHLTADIDPGRFAQIISNLLGNAFDAIEPEGTITISVDANESAAVFKIVDNGAGLSPEQLTEVLKPFVSFKANGTGLGLALVNRFVKLHDGLFTLQSTLGEGLTAIIVIPRNEKSIS